MILAPSSPALPEVWVREQKSLNTILYSMRPCSSSLSATWPTVSPSSISTTAVRAGLLRASTSLAQIQPTPARRAEMPSTKMT